MGFWAILRCVIGWLPTAISVVTSIFEAIESLHEKERGIAYNALWHAMAYAKVTGDLRPLEDVKDRCGLRCRIDRTRAQKEARRYARGD